MKRGTVSILLLMLWPLRFLLLALPVLFALWPTPVQAAAAFVQASAGPLVAPGAAIFTHLGDNVGGSFNGLVQFGWYNADFASPTTLGNTIVWFCAFNAANLGSSNLVGGWAGHGAEVATNDSTAYNWDATNGQGLGAVYVNNIGHGGYGGTSPITTCAESSSENEATAQTSSDTVAAEEISGIACPIVIDGHAAGNINSSGTTLTLATMSGLTTGDYIIAAMEEDTAVPSGSISAGSGYTLGANNWSVTGMATEHQVLSGTSATPTFTVPTGFHFLYNELALRAGAGCNSTGPAMIIQSRQLIDSNNFPGNGTAITIHKMVGDLFVLNMLGGNNTTPTYADSASNTYSKPTGTGLTNGCSSNNLNTCMAYTAHGTTPSTVSINNGSATASLVLYDLKGFPASPFDVAKGGGATDSNGGNPHNISGTSTITTNFANEAVIGNIVVTSNCVINTTDGHFFFGPPNENQGPADYEPTATGTYGPTYQANTCQQAGGVGVWADILAGFKAASQPSGTVPGFNKQRRYELMEVPAR